MTAKAADILKWMGRDLHRFASPDLHFEVANPSENEVVVRVYTEVNKYSVRARSPSADGIDKGYLGCTSQSRKPRAGETHCRGNDLADGDLSEETWTKIKNDIVSYEIVKLAANYRR